MVTRSSLPNPPSMHHIPRPVARKKHDPHLFTNTWTQGSGVQTAVEHNTLSIHLSTSWTWQASHLRHYITPDSRHPTSMQPQPATTTQQIQSKSAVTSSAATHWHEAQQTFSLVAGRAARWSEAKGCYLQLSFSYWQLDMSTFPLKTSCGACGCCWNV